MSAETRRPVTRMSGADAAAYDTSRRLATITAWVADAPVERLELALLVFLAKCVPVLVVAGIVAAIVHHLNGA